ncbi:threonine dehydrogenase-like Zn-dependent dehydrogenase [Streptomyces phaeochromogenes]|nr:threonine dehydrogenase-like Zn-dependent dehydrogenase [Streptomyces phaeochromogenes]
MPRNTVPWHGAVWHMTRVRGTLTVIGDGAIGLWVVQAAKRLGALRSPGRELGEDHPDGR